ncbi:MAG: hypothetical protein Q4D91_06610, partial [Lautropia sp.]|nr:hypothetical protein [Lautropia sp.]
MAGKLLQARFPVMDEARQDGVSLPTAQPGHGGGEAPEPQGVAAHAEEAHVLQTAMLPVSDPTEGLSSPSVGTAASGVEVARGVQTVATVSATSAVHPWLGALATQVLVSNQYSSSDTASAGRLHDNLAKVGKPAEDANDRRQPGHAGQTPTEPSDASTGQPTPAPSDVPGGVGKPNDSGVPSLPGQPGGAG